MPIRRVLLSLFITLHFSCAAIAGEGILADISVTAKLDIVDKYMWRSVDLWNGGAALQPDFTVTYNPLGIYIGVWSAYSITSNCTDSYGDRCSDWDENDYYIGYFSSLFDGTRYQTNYDISYIYYSFYKYPVNVDAHEVALALSHPNLIPEFNGISVTPYYTIYRGWPLYSDGKSTFWVKAGLRESVTVMDRPVHGYLETYYEDGGGVLDLQRGFANIATGISLDQKIGRFLTISPAVNYQWALIPSPQPGLVKSQFWGGIRISVSF